MENVWLRAGLRRQAVAPITQGRAEEIRFHSTYSGKPRKTFHAGRNIT